MTATTAGADTAAADSRTAALRRVVLAGGRGRTPALLPAHTPVGELLPHLVRLSGDRTAVASALPRLVTGDGRVLDADATLASAEVPDGGALRLTLEGESTAAMPAHDLTVGTWRWGPRARLWTAASASVLLGLLAAVAALVWFGADAAGRPLAAAAVVCAAAGAGVALTRPAGGRGPGAALILLAGAVGLLAAWTLTGPGPLRLAGLALAAAATLALLGLCTGLGRGGYTGAAAVVLLAGGWESAWGLWDGPSAGAVLGVVSVLALGLLPRLALTAAGLTRIDDRRAGGASVSHHRVDLALAAAHRELAPATVATALSASAAGWAALAEASVWTVGFAGLLGALLFCRARAFPLAVEVAALHVAGGVLAVRLVTVWAAEGAGAAPVAALCVLALLPLAALAARPGDALRLRLRRGTNLLESISAVVLVPVAVGAAGVYGAVADLW